MAYVAGSMNDNVPGSYEIKALRLYSKFGEGLDLNNMLTELSIYEDIFNNCIFGKLTLTESFNFIGNLPMVEGDIIRVWFGVNQNDAQMKKADNIKEELKIDLEIIRISDRVTLKQDISAYTLSLASTGWSDNHFQRVSKSYSKKKYSEMVDDIFKKKFQSGGLIDFDRDSSFLKEPKQESAFSKKDIEIEKTDGEYCIVFPNWHPLRCFNFLASRSTDGNDVADWLFYEDPEKYRFVSVNSRLKKGPVGKHYVLVSNIKEGPEAEDKLEKNIYLNFFDISYSNSGNLLESASNGLLSNNLLVYDFYNRKATEYWKESSPEADNYKIEESFRYDDNFDKKEHCEKKEHLSLKETIDKFCKDPGGGKKTFILEHPKMWDSQDKGYEFDKFTRQRSSQRTAINHLKLSVTGYGLFSRKVGDVIELELPSPQVDHAKIDSRLTGNYLITALRRVFNRTEHRMTLELTKDDYFSKDQDHFWTKAKEQKFEMDRDELGD